MERTAHPEFAPFWTELAAGRLSFPRCASCRKHHWYPMKRCPHCLGQDIHWEAVAGHGTLYSWTVVRHAFDTELRDQVPYVVALVEFPEAPGVRLVTNLVDAAAGDLRIGMPVVACFDLPSPGPGPLPARLCFRPDGTGAAARPASD